jgi:hypothetical protein
MVGLILGEGAQQILYEFGMIFALQCCIELPKISIGVQRHSVIDTEYKIYEFSQGA